VNNVKPKTAPGYSFTLTTPAPKQSRAATSKERFAKAIRQAFRKSFLHLSQKRFDEFAELSLRIH
jgi:hypothetical protein